MAEIITDEHVATGKSEVHFATLRKHISSLPKYVTNAKIDQTNILEEIVQTYEEHEVSPADQLEYFSLLKWMFQCWMCIETIALERKINEEKLPSVLINSIKKLAVTLKREPVMVYEDYIMLNTVSSTDVSQISDIVEFLEPATTYVVPKFTFTGLIDEQWFIQIHVFVEEALKNVLAKIRQICLISEAKNDETPEIDVLIDVLRDVTAAISLCGPYMKRMIEHCAPDVFLNTVRKYFVKIPKRYFQPGVAGTYAGCSGAQASFEPILDAFLGIKFKPTSGFDFYEYLPPQDRALMVFLYKNNVRDAISTHVKKTTGDVVVSPTMSQAASSAVAAVAAPGSDGDGDDIRSPVLSLKRQYNDAIDAMIEFRELHLSFIMDYIPGMQGSGGTAGSKPLRARIDVTAALKFTEDELCSSVPVLPTSAGADAAAAVGATVVTEDSV